MKDYSNRHSDSLPFSFANYAFHPWSQHPTLQVNYAAADAIVALHIIQSLVELKLSRQGKRESLAGLSEEDNMSPFSLRPSLSSQQQQPLEEWLSKKENLSCLLSMCQGIVEMPYKQRRRNSQVHLHMLLYTACKVRVQSCTVETVTHGPIAKHQWL